MDTREAKELLAQEISGIQDLAFPVLRELATVVQTKELTGPSGTRYQLEIKAFWDDKDKEHLRVSVAIDDRGIRAFMPMTADFITSPNGPVGE